MLVVAEAGVLAGALMLLPVQLPMGLLLRLLLRLLPNLPLHLPLSPAVAPNAALPAIFASAPVRTFAATSACDSPRLPAAKPSLVSGPLAAASAGSADVDCRSPPLPQPAPERTRFGHGGGERRGRLAAPPASSRNCASR